MPKPSEEKRKLLEKLSKLVLTKPGPSAYLSALYEEGTVEEIKAEIQRHKEGQS